MRKRGQVTIFILVAILIVATIILFFMLIGSSGKEDVSFIPDSDLHLIRSSIIDCIDSVAIDGVRLIGLQGGYIFSNNDSLDTGTSNMAYGYYNGENTLPALKEMQNEINDYIEIALPVCFDESQFGDFDLSFGEIESNTEIEGSSIMFSIEYTLFASRESASSSLEQEYKTEIFIRLGDIHRRAIEMIEKEKENPGYIDLSLLGESDYEVAILPYKEDILIYSITDEIFEINDVPYTFIFANKI